MFSFGVNARNLNSPKFDGVEVESIGGGTTVIGDFTLDPQVTIGAAFMPFKLLVITLDADLLETDTLFPDISTAICPWWC